MNPPPPDLNPNLLLPLLLLGLGTLAAGVRICRFLRVRPAGVALAATGLVLVAGVILEAAGLPSAWTVDVATRLTGPIAVLLYPRISPRDWLHWVLIAVGAMAGTVAVLAPQDGYWVTAAMVTVAITVAAHLWWRGGRWTGADRRAISTLGVGVVAAVVAYAILVLAPASALPGGSYVLAGACVPAAMVLGVRRPDPRGLKAVAASATVTAVAALVAASAYILVISLVTRAAGRPTRIVEEALAILLCAACLELIRRTLQKRVDGRWPGARPGGPDVGRLGLHEGLGRRLAGIARDTDTLSDLLDPDRGIAAAEARQVVAAVQVEAAAALEEVRRLSFADPA